MSPTAARSNFVDGRHQPERRSARLSMAAAAKTGTTCRTKTLAGGLAMKARGTTAASLATLPHTLTPATVATTPNAQMRTPPMGATLCLAAGTANVASAIMAAPPTVTSTAELISAPGRFEVGRSRTRAKFRPNWAKLAMRDTNATAPAAIPTTFVSNNRAVTIQQTNPRPVVAVTFTSNENEFDTRLSPNSPRTRVPSRGTSSGNGGLPRGRGARRQPLEGLSVDGEGGLGHVVPGSR